MMGSPLYMSPEQLRSSADVDARADIWALGVILYELLTRETPFVADSLPQLCTAILESKPIPIATYRSDLPPAVAELIEACLHKACADRIATVADFAQRLAELGPPHALLSAQRIARIAAGGVHTNRPRAGAHGTAVEVSTPPSTDGTLALAASPAKESPAPAAARVPTPETAPATPAGEGSAGDSAVPPGESPVVGRVAPPTPDGPAAANAVLPAAERPALPIVPARAASAMPSAQRPVRAIVLAAATALAGAGLIVWLQPCATAPAPNEIHVAVPARGKVAASPEPASRPARTPVTSAPTAAEPPPALPVGVVTMPKPVPAAPATTPVRRSPASRASRAEAPSGTRPVSAAEAGADRPVRTKSPVERKRTAAKPPSESIPVQQRPLGGRI
jgi:serine/threonine-protein kinase